VHIKWVRDEDEDEDEGCSRCTLYYWEWNAPPWPRATCGDSSGIYFVFHLHSPGTLFPRSLLFFTIIWCLICISSALPDSDPDMRRRSVIFGPGQRDIPRPDSLHPKICFLRRGSLCYVHLHRCTASFCSCCFI